MQPRLGSFNHFVRSGWVLHEVKRLAQFHQPVDQQL